MSREDFNERTKTFALHVIERVDALPRNPVSEQFGDRLLRAGTSVAANYRAATRGRSSAELVAKTGIVEEECDECLFWMELLVDAGRTSAARLAPLRQEGNGILALTVASIKTARRGR